MSFYKLVQFLKNYINPEEVDGLIEICSYTTWIWLNKLGYSYEDVYKDVFVDWHKQPDIVKDCVNFLKVIKDLKPYIVKFEEDKTMKPEIYPNNCIVEDSNWRSVIRITHDKYIFFANNGV